MTAKMVRCPKRFIADMERELTANAHKGGWKDCKREVRWFFKNIVRVVVWAPTIWRDRDWDPEDLYKIMRFKINRMRRDQYYCGYEEMKSRRVKCGEMRLAEDLLDKLVADEYDGKAFRDHQRIYGKRKMVLDPAENGSARVRFVPEPSKASKKDLLRRSLRAYEDKKADMRRLTDLIRDHSLGWWD